VFTRGLHSSSSWATWIQSTPSHLISLTSIPVLSCHLRLGRRSGHFLSGSPTKILHAFLICHIHATFPTHLIVLGTNTQLIFREEYKLWSLPLYGFIQPSVTLRLPT
jgi:hypothetical protein